jgi:hypothetical protein
MEENERLQEKNKRLIEENNKLLNQFVIWQYNASNKGITRQDLEAPLPDINRTKNVK